MSDNKLVLRRSHGVKRTFVDDFLHFAVGGEAETVLCWPRLTLVKMRKGWLVDLEHICLIFHNSLIASTSFEVELPESRGRSRGVTRKFVIRFRRKD